MRFWLAGMLGLGVSWAQETPVTSVDVSETRVPVWTKERVTEPFANFRLFLNYSAETDGQVSFNGVNQSVEIKAGEYQEVDFLFEHVPEYHAKLRVRRGAAELEEIQIPNSLVELGGSVFESSLAEAALTFPMSGDYTLMVRFQANADGTLFAKAPAEGEWQPNGKTFFIRDGRLVYDIGWVGDLVGETPVTDGGEHIAVLRVLDNRVQIRLNGELDAVEYDLASPDDRNHIVKIGSTATDFGGDFKDGEIHQVLFWKRALEIDEIEALESNTTEVNTPDFHWTPSQQSSPDGLELVDTVSVPGFATTVSVSEGIKVHEAWVQPLQKTSHYDLVRGWDTGSLGRGKAYYQQLCATCHGSLTQEGSIPLALKFHEGEFKNGKDPFRMWQTLEKGYGLMMAQPQYTTAQKYDLIHYIREGLIKEHNSSQYSVLSADYMRDLPRGLSVVKEQKKKMDGPAYKQMDFGPALFWTYQIEPGEISPEVNIAQKGIAIPLSPAEGGVTRAKRWAIYDHDTMRLATVFEGDDFVDWKGIAFDGSHGTHTSILGERLMVQSDTPGWAEPGTTNWEAPRVKGRDGRQFGPIPKSWARFKGLQFGRGGPLLEYAVGDAWIYERTVDAEEGDFERQIWIAHSSKDLRINLGRFGQADYQHIIRSKDTPMKLVVHYSVDDLSLSMKQEVFDDAELTELMAPADQPALPVLTSIVPGGGKTAFATDMLTVPEGVANPSNSWMRLSGIDFFSDGRRAAVCTWMGDVWIVDGIDQNSGELTWTRFASGLFQPLGLKIVEDEIYVSCRDMIALVHDRNNDGTADYIECFNNDHQVTEHFHEFAMGLQTDEGGNFYYAKSARHALPAVVPHHGTLIKVSRDGYKTDILASGFRAANGVCLNPDGSFIVTDQEGHWNPKNRINWVQGKGEDEFFGNIFGYTPVTDTSDSAMTPPLCWITNAFDRSPAELVWVPESANWGSLTGSLLNLSYGYGKIYVVPHETVSGQVQGGMCELPLPQFATGIMRGRFHPDHGHLFTCGMFAWAGSQKASGGLYRIRYQEEHPAYVPIQLTTRPGVIQIGLSDSVDIVSARDPNNYTIKTWDLERTEKYGSKHLNERELSIDQIRVLEGGKSIELVIGELQPTRGMSIDMKLLDSRGRELNRLIHNTIHRLEEPPPPPPPPAEEEASTKQEDSESP
ncbi:MAG: DUF6797 domain-containing protein [Verrucomicrobiota bacterium]